MAAARPRRSRAARRRPARRCRQGLQVRERVPRGLDQVGRPRVRHDGQPDGPDDGAEDRPCCRRSTSATASAAAAWARSPAASRRTPTARAARTWRKLAIDLVKQGKGLGDILAAIDDKQKPSGGAAPVGAPRPRVARRRSSRSPHDLRRGAEATKVTIVEFSDFQCPFCKRSEPTVKGVLDKYGKDVSLVWMNQPLPFHDHAMDAATAFQAAGRQGADKAWKLHDKMYENNTALTRADIEKYAGEVGLNTGKFKKDWDDPKIKAEVDQDSKAGDRGRRQRHADLLHQRPRGGRARSRPTRSRRSSTTRSRRRTSSSRRGRRSRTSTRSGSRRPRSRPRRRRRPRPPRPRASRTSSSATRRSRARRAPR